VKDEGERKEKKITQASHSDLWISPINPMGSCPNTSSKFVWVYNLGKLDFMSYHNPDEDNGVGL
jgi:hypothetical protein